MKAQCKVNSLVTHLLQNKVNKLSKYLNPFINCFSALQNENYFDSYVHSGVWGAGCDILLCFF